MYRENHQDHNPEARRKWIPEAEIVRLHLQSHLRFQKSVENSKWRNAQQVQRQAYQTPNPDSADQGTFGFRLLFQWDCLTVAQCYNRISMRIV